MAHEKNEQNLSVDFTAEQDRRHFEEFGSSQLKRKQLEAQLAQLQSQREELSIKMANPKPLSQALVTMHNSFVAQVLLRIAANLLVLGTAAYAIVGTIAFLSGALALPYLLIPIAAAIAAMAIVGTIAFFGIYYAKQQQQDEIQLTTIQGQIANVGYALDSLEPDAELLNLGFNDPSEDLRYSASLRFFAEDSLEDFNIDDNEASNRQDMAEIRADLDAITP